MADELGIEVLLGTTFVDKNILAILSDERKATVRDLKPVAIVET